MVPTKTWLAIPVLALACLGLGFAARMPPETCVALGALGAALAAAVRAFAGPSIAAAVAASAAALLGTLAVLELPHDIDLIRAALAGAAAMFAIGELTRPLPPDASPWPALGAATLATVLDPSYVALLPIAGIRLMTGPWSRPRWAIAIPLVAILVLALAILTALLRDGALASLWHVWVARSAPAASSLAILTAHGDLLGPVSTVVAAAGLASCAMRGNIPAAIVIGTTAAAIAIDLLTGTMGAATLVLAALGAGTGISRFAALIRWPAGQACVGAAVGVMLVVAPAWTLALG